MECEPASAAGISAEAAATKASMDYVEFYTKTMMPMASDDTEVFFDWCQCLRFTVEHLPP